MKKDIFIFAAFTVITIVILFSNVENNVVDIQLHDTYLILEKLALVVLVIGPLASLIFFPLALVRKFKTTSTNIGLIIGLGLISLILFRVAQLQSSYRDEVRMSTSVPLPPADKERFAKEMNTKITLTWGLFGVCVVGIGLTGFRTYKIVRKK